MLSKMIVGLVPVWKDLSINLWVIAALNPDLFFPFLVESQVVLIWQNGNFFSRLLFCLLAAHSTSSAQQNPSSTSSQDHQETGLHRFRNCTVNKDADSRTKQHTDNTTKTTSPPPHPTHSLLPVPAWQDEYLTAARPFLSSFFLVLTFRFFCLKLMQSATGSMLHRWVVTEFIHAVHRATSRLYQDIVFRQISLDHRLSPHWPALKYRRAH